jgi:hypothetical protein
MIWLTFVSTGIENLLAYNGQVLDIPDFDQIHIDKQISIKHQIASTSLLYRVSPSERLKRLKLIISDLSDSEYEDEDVEALTLNLKRLVPAPGASFDMDNNTYTIPPQALSSETAEIPKPESTTIVDNDVVQSTTIVDNDVAQADCSSDADYWNEYCEVCNDGGDLLQCEECPRVYHLACIDLQKVLLMIDKFI